MTPAAAKSAALARAARRLARGEPLEVEAAAAGELAGLRVVDAIARLAREERRAIAGMPAGADAPTARAAAANPGVPLPFATWGPLTLVERVGEGSYGEVFRAHDSGLRIDVALKLWFPTWSAAASMDDLLEEARTLARIRHANVLTVHGAARHGDRAGMWTELLHGRTLEETIAERGPFGVLEAALIGVEVCRALAAVHASGLVHRDVKTTNVMRAEGGRIVLMDFGSVARTVRAPSTEEEFLLVGTPAAIAPEQLAGRQVGPAADFYSVGAMLYRLVSGHYPIEAASLEDLIARHARGERTPLRDRCPGVPQEFVDVIERCLAPDPAARFASAGALEQALLRFVRAVPAADAPAADGTAAPPRRHNLRAPLTRFVGREHTLAECRRLLAETRLLTLTGVAGCGKTRLALGLGEGLLDGSSAGSPAGLEPPDGVWFVELAPLADGAHVVAAVARVLGVAQGRGKDVIEGVIAHLGDRATVLVLDNCEHLVAATAEAVIALLDACPRLRIVTTSREPLGVPGEVVFAVPSLSRPRAGDTDAASVGRSEAVQLFVNSAALALPGFRLTGENAASVGEICRRLDGIPFALELAAARVRMLAVDEVLARLDNRFKLLTGGSRWALSRHQTLLETLRWSYDLLRPEEQAVLRRLSVFAGGCTIEAAQQVCVPEADGFETLDVLAHLVDKSLVVAEHDLEGATRYSLLETVRLFALQSLAESGEREVTRDRHLECFVRFAETYGEIFRSGAGIADALAVSDRQHENVLAALAWCEERGARGQALRIAGSFFPYWAHRTQFSLGLGQVLRALADPGPHARSLEHARATFAAANLTYYSGKYEDSTAHAESSLEMFRALGDEPGIVWSLNALANVRMALEEYATCRTLYEESLEVARACGYTRGMAIALNNLAELATESSDFAQALPLFQESVELNRRLDRLVGVGLNLSNVAFALVNLGRASEGVDVMLECLGIARKMQRRDHGERAIGVAAVLLEQLGRSALAARLLEAARVVRENIGTRLTPSEQRSQDAAIDRLRERLGPDALEACLAEGRALDFEAALEQAIDGLKGGGVGASAGRARSRAPSPPWP